MTRTLLYAAAIGALVTALLFFGHVLVLNSAIIIGLLVALIVLLKG